MTLLKIVQNVELVLLKMQNKKLKIFIVAGEVSGDVLGARIMHEMPGVEFVGIGGENMSRAGLNSLFPMRDLAVMGAVEVLAHARTLTKRINQTVRAIMDEKPDVVLTIDSPGFAKSVVSKIRNSIAGKNMIAHGMRFHHVVAPQVWAWRPGRAKKYACLFDKLYAFFDFELPYFTKYGLSTMAVGHPISDGLIGKISKTTDEKVIALVPGSRISEVKRLLPLYRDVVAKLGNKYRYAIPTVETTREYVTKYVRDWPIAVDLIDAKSRYDLYAKTYIAIAASGTVSAELAMMHIPAIIVYRMNPITVWLVRQFIRVKWASLVNIVLNRSVYPEFLGPAANTENVVNEFKRLTRVGNRVKMIKLLASADELWQRNGMSPAGIIATDLMSVKKQDK